MWCRARRTQWCFAVRLTGDRGYCLDFNELLGVSKKGDSDERAGHVMLTESLTHHIPHCDEILAFARCDQDTCADDVGDVRIGVGKCLFQVVQTYPGLLDIVVRCRRRPVWVQGTCAGQKDEATG